MAEVFLKRTHLPVSAERVYQWHIEPGALEKLMPPWEPARVTERTGGTEQIGSRVVISVGVGPLHRTWTSMHTACEPGRMFRDEQVSGPFAQWVHTHSFIPDGANASWLEDRIEYKLPLGWLGRIAAGGYVRRKLERMFEYRHRIASQALNGRAGETPQ
jgi:hypothetical protein